MQHDQEPAIRYRAVPPVGWVTTPGPWRATADEALADVRSLSWQHGGEWRVEGKA